MGLRITAVPPTHIGCIKGFAPLAVVMVLSSDYAAGHYLGFGVCKLLDRERAKENSIVDSGQASRTLPCSLRRTCWWLRAPRLAEMLELVLMVVGQAQLWECV